MTEPAFPVPYPRPTSLSDLLPSAWAAERAAELLAKRDEELRDGDFYTLLDTVDSASYEEAVYFLPIALTRLRSDGDADLLRPVGSFLGFNWHLLERDGLDGPVRATLVDCLRGWTAAFNVRHWDREACRAKGWGLNYSDAVVHGDVTLSTLEMMVDVPALKATAIDFLMALAAEPDDAGAAGGVRSAWFLEMASNYRASSSDSCLWRRVKKTDVPALMEDDARLRRHAEAVVAGLPGFDPAATYWRDLLVRLWLTGLPGSPDDPAFPDAVPV